MSFNTVSYLIVLLLIVKINGVAQPNLVPNYSFEDTVACPNNYGQIYYATPWIDATGASPDLYNTCSDSFPTTVPLDPFGFQYPHTGNGYVGIAAFDFVNNYREYPQVQLTQQLEASQLYCVDFYLSLSDSSGIAVNNIGVYFSNAPVTGFIGDVLSVTPQFINPTSNVLSDTANWMHVSFTYLANGTENYMTIGNFSNDSLSDTLIIDIDYLRYFSYYYLDDVSVKLCKTDGFNRYSDWSFSVYLNRSTSSIEVNEIDVDEILLTDISGRVIYEQYNSNNSINMSNNSPGLYLVHVLFEGQYYTMKVIW